MESGDPFIFVRSSSVVLHAYHGEDEWDPVEMFPDLNTMAACLGELGGVRVACMQGRVHAYEGHALSRVVFGARFRDANCGFRLMRTATVRALLSNHANPNARESNGGQTALMWALSERQSAVVEGIRVRLQEEPSEAWDRTWLALTLRLPADRRQRERLALSMSHSKQSPCVQGENTIIPCRPLWMNRADVMKQNLFTLMNGC
jgi:hypothetical protein